MGIRNANDAPGALNEGTAKGFDFAKAPQRGTFRRRAAGARRESHQFPGQVGDQEHVQLVSNPRLDRYVAHLAVRLELGKDSLLRPPSFVEGTTLRGLVLLLVTMTLNSYPYSTTPRLGIRNVFSDEDEAIASVPRLRLPADHYPSWGSGTFDHFFETAKALERHRDGQLGPSWRKSINDGLVEERAVDTDLYLCPRQARAHGTHTSWGSGTLESWTLPGLMHIEHLVGLGDGAKQGVVAARTLFLPPCMARIESKSSVTLANRVGHQALNDHSARLDSDFADALFICTTPVDTDQEAPV